MIAFACLIVEHGAAFSFLYVYLMIHGHEIARSFGVFQGYLFGSSMGAGPGLFASSSYCKQDTEDLSESA